MDQNASANVQGAQANPVPAAADTANVTNPTPAAADAAKGVSQTTDPGAGVADTKPSFDPEIQKFLDNQNIKTDDLKAAVTELAKRNMKLRGNQSEAQSVAEVLKQPQTPVKTEEPKAVPTEPQQTSQPHTLSDMDIATVSMFIKQQYPDVTADAAFYKSMIADGFKPTTADGGINLKSVQSYAAYKQKLAEAEKVIANNQPQANQIPQPSTAPEYADVDKVQTMTEQAAQNIILFSNREKRYGRPVHPQFDEAAKFLQNLARK